MAPSTAAVLQLSPAELSYLRASLSYKPPIRPEVGRSARDLRAMRAECDVLPNAYGSARIALDDGTEALVGVKAEVEKSPPLPPPPDDAQAPREEDAKRHRGQRSWLDISVDMPGYRDDDALPVFLACTLSDSLLADAWLVDRLYINARFHWRLYVDILLLSPPLSYPLSLLSMTTHLALLTTRLPCLVSQGDEDPLFSDDWQAATPLYPAPAARVGSAAAQAACPPVILLTMSVGQNILLDPTPAELSVADTVLAVAVALSPAGKPRLVALRTVPPPSLHTPSGVPDALNSATGGVAPSTAADAITQRECNLAKANGGSGGGVWAPPRGGAKPALIAKMVGVVLEAKGVGEEVLEGLARTVAAGEGL